jgi:DNA helicase-2/ATP-dependent DNA helicase PcrA
MSAARKAQLGVLDFDDMLVRCHALFTGRGDVLACWRKRYRHLLIDEFQDINRVQFECVKLLTAQGGPQLFVVGDDDQSIYRFRGARPEFLLQFRREYPEGARITLAVNYRSTERIIRFCNRVIAQNQARFPKKTEGTGREGKGPYFLTAKDITEEAKAIGALIRKTPKAAWNGTAVIYRVNLQARAFADAFMDLNIPYQLKDELPRIYDHWIAQDIHAYFSLALHRNLDGALARIINKPARYISKALVERARKQGGGLLAALYASPLETWQLARVEELMLALNTVAGLAPYKAFRYIRETVGYEQYLRKYAEYKKMQPAPFLEVLNELHEATRGFATLAQYLAHRAEPPAQPEGPPFGVTLTTMHSAKGLEFDTVFVASAVEGCIPHERSKTPEEMEEERRLLYVALTRAREALYISLVQTRYEKEALPSRFLTEAIPGPQGKK